MHIKHLSYILFSFFSEPLVLEIDPKEYSTTMFKSMIKTVLP